MALPEYTDHDALVGITHTISPACLHLNGWWDTVAFSIASKRVFACTDCQRVLNGWDVPSHINEVR